MEKVSKLINKDLRKNLLNNWWGVYKRYKPKYDNTTFEQFLKLNLFYYEKNGTITNTRQTLRLRKGTPKRTG